MNTEKAAPRAGARLDVALAALFFLGVVMLVSSTGMDVGIAWAEDDYLDHLDVMRRWFDAWRSGTLTPELQRGAWEDKRYFLPHPPLYKWMALLCRALLPDLPFPVAERLPSALALAALGTTCGVVLSPVTGRLAAWTGSLALVTAPRVLGHAHFLTTDIHVAAGGSMLLLFHARWMESAQARFALGVLASLVLASGSKITGLMALAPAALASLAVHGVRDRRALLRDAWMLCGALLLALGFFCVQHPFTWDGPVTRVLELVQQARTWAREHPFSALYLGHAGSHLDMPWHFPVGITLLVMPPVALAAALVGVVPRRGSARAWVVTCGVLTWGSLAFLPGFPRYDNERQLLPFLCVLLLGVPMGLSRLARGEPGTWRARAGGPACALVAASSILALAGSLPFPLGYYSPIAGGAPGAVEHGMEPTYLGEVLSPSTLAALDPALPRGAGLSVYPAPRLGSFLQRRGWLRADLVLTPDRGPFHLVFLRHAVGTPEFTARIRRGVLVAAVPHLGVDVVHLWYVPPEPHGQAPP